MFSLLNHLSAFIVVMCIDLSFYVQNPIANNQVAAWQVWHMQSSSSKLVLEKILMHYEVVNKNLLELPFITLWRIRTLIFYTKELLFIVFKNNNL